MKRSILVTSRSGALIKMGSGFVVEVILQGQVVQRQPVDPAGVSFGRARTNQVVLTDARVSKEHARLRIKDGGFLLSDLGSACGTLVQGKKVRETVVAPGTEIQIGPFLIRIVKDSAGSGVPCPQTPGRSDSTEEFRRLVKSLTNLTGLVGLTDVQTILETLLERSTALVGARTGFVVLAHEGELSPVLARKGAEAEVDEGFSRTICQEALTKRQPVILTRAANMARLNAIASLVEKHPTMVLAVPLTDGGNALGVLYLEGDEELPFPLIQESEVLSEVSTLGGRALRSALERRQIIGDNDRWRSLFNLSYEEPDIFRSAKSPSMRDVLDLIRSVSQEDVTVLITGESGTGKEVTALTIHQLSPRQSGPFTALNCGAIPRELMEAELFGYEKGAFTGAVAKKLGRFELAQGGTLLLDEIGELPKDLQVKLLRVLEKRSFERLGGQQSIRLDVRLVAATNRTLADMVARGDFREDLYYRLNVVEVHIPPLRQRLEDLEPLIHEILLACNRRFRRKLYGVTPEAVDILRSYQWPGNIRELRNVIERAFILEKSDRIGPASLPFQARPVPTDPNPSEETAEIDESEVLGLSDYLLRQERDYIRLILDRAHGKVTQAARLLKVHRTALHRRMRQLDLVKTDTEPDDEP